MKKKWIYILLWTWQLPQNLLGVIYRSLNRKSIIAEINKDAYYHAYLMRNGRSISLGEYVFVQQDYRDKVKYFEDYIAQSVISILTGPLYLVFRILVYLIKSAF